MGSPRKLRSSVTRPLRPFDRVRLEYETELKKEYGFKRKREIWKLQQYFKNLKRRARNILATHDKEEEKALMKKLSRYGLGNGDFTLDDVLNLSLENVCERRLQTIVFKKGLASTLNQARQLVTHRKVIIGDMIVDMPNYLVDVEQEKKIKLRERKPKAKKEEKKVEAPVEGEGKVEASPEEKTAE